MRAGNLRHRVVFYEKTTTKDAYNSAVDSWDSVSFATRGEIRYRGGSMISSNEERFFTKSMELTIRYRDFVKETMRVKIDNKDDIYTIDSIEEIGNREALRLTIEKLNV